jgi:serine/threonine-protein kinase
VSETIGRYELITEIGRGGMAEVKLALDREANKLVVLKLLREELASDAATVAMLHDEAKLAAQVRHPNVVEIFEQGEADGRHYIAMEYLEGESLLAVLEKGTLGKRIDPLSLARVVAGVAAGLEAAHDKQVVHHDISPGNVFVLYSGQVKLLDFGVAKATKQPGKPFGKLAYAAPEKLDERPGDKRSDIWSLGCVLWEALTLKRLFKGATDVEIMREVRYVNVRPPSTVNSEVPAEFDAIVRKCLQRDPSKRYQSAKEVGAAIEDVLTAKEYPEKNFKIGTFMMQAFHDRVAAREQLVRAVTGPERPSAEVIEAAFGENRAEPSRSGFDLDALLDPANQVVLPEGSTGADVAIATPTVNPFDDAPTEFDEIPANAEASRAHRDTPDPSWIRSKHGKAIEDLQRRAQAEREFPEQARRKRVMQIAAAVGGALVLVIAIVGIKSCGKKSPVVAKPEAAPVMVIDAALATVEIDAAPQPEEIEMPAEDLTPDKEEDQPEPVKPERPKPTKSAKRLYAEGLAAWKKNDTKAAYALWTEGRRASSTYANNWYGLGLVHEKAGRKKDARTAFERYLKLAPNSPIGGKLRDHIKKDLM